MHEEEALATEMHFPVLNCIVTRRSDSKATLSIHLHGVLRRASAANDAKSAVAVKSRQRLIYFIMPSY